MTLSSDLLKKINTNLAIVYTLNEPIYTVGDSLGSQTVYTVREQPQTVYTIKEPVPTVLTLAPTAETPPTLYTVKDTSGGLQNHLFTVKEPQPPSVQIQQPQQLTHQQVYAVKDSNGQTLYVLKEPENATGVLTLRGEPQIQNTTNTIYIKEHNDLAHHQTEHHIQELSCTDDIDDFTAHIQLAADNNSSGGGSGGQVVLQSDEEKKHAERVAATHRQVNRLISAGLEPVLSHTKKIMYIIVLQTIFHEY